MRCRSRLSSAIRDCLARDANAQSAFASSSVHNNDYRRAEWPSEENECEQDRVFLARFARLKTGMAGRKRHRFSAFWLRFQFGSTREESRKLRRSSSEYKRIVWSLWLWFVFGRFWSFLVVYLVSWSFLFVFVRLGRLWSSWSSLVVLVVLGRLWSSVVVFGRGSWVVVRGSWSCLVLLMAAIPFAAKALVGTIPEEVMASAGTNPITLKEMIDDFVRQLPEVNTIIENVMQTGATTFVVHCFSPRHVEILLHSGLTFRGHLVKLVAAPNTQWIKLTRVVYGTTENAIKSRLSDYGTVLKIRRELVQGIGISVYSVKIELRKPIPSRITISHYPVNVFYRGQVQQCFRCEQTGHLSKNCPFKASSGVPPARIVGEPVVVVDRPAAVGDRPAASDSSSVVVDSPVENSVVDLPAMETDLPSGRPVSDVPDFPSLPSLTASNSESSASTPVNPTSGKRQLPASASSAPAKKDKPESVVPSYIEYEREVLRIYVLGSGATPADRAAATSLQQRIPETLLPRYSLTVNFRHPTLTKGGSATRLFEDLAKFSWPAYCCDITESELFHPVLPPNTPPSDVPYLRYDLVRTYMECRKKYPDLADVPADVKAEIDRIPLDTLTAFGTYYASTHPECMAGVTDEVKDAIIGAFINRTAISYET